MKKGMKKSSKYSTAQFSGVNNKFEFLQKQRERAYLLSSALGLTVFFLLIFGSPFNINLFSLFYSKPQSQASVTTQYIQGDINRDRSVDSKDLTLFAEKWSQGDMSADIDKNGVINSNDLSILIQNMGK